MKRFLGIIGASLLSLIFLGFVTSSFKTYDYGLKCTRCLQEYHVVKKSFLGVTYSKTQTLEFAGYDHELESITGKPCEHVYRTNGFGRESYMPFFLGRVMGDGDTAEGEIFRWRFMALRNAFTLYQRLPNKELMLQTFAIIDECLPADADVKSVYDPYHPVATKRAYISLLVNPLADATTEAEWKAALDKTKADMVETASR